MGMTLVFEDNPLINNTIRILLKPGDRPGALEEG